MRFSFLISFLLPICLSAQKDSISMILQNHIDHTSEKGVHSMLFYVYNESEGILCNEGIGLAKKDGEGVSETAQFKIASISKPFVAAVVFQMIEEGKLDLKDKVSEYLEEIDFLDFDRLHYFEQQSYASEISIEDLLSHRSGLADIYREKSFRFFLNVFLEPEKQYTPNAIVEKYYRYGLNKDAHFKPGDDFYYSDMNYVLLGILIEQMENRPLAEIIRTRILNPLQLKDTYFEYYEPATGQQQRLHQYINEIDMTSVNTSFDWAGGGLVSTTRDLAVFINALFSGQIINDRSLQLMIEMKSISDGENRYGMGIDESVYNGDIYYGHYGFYGSYVGYCPKNNSSIVYNISQAQTDFPVYDLVEEILKIAKTKKGSIK